MTDANLAIERIQLGVRLEKRMVKVLKALAEKGDVTLAELLEDIILHALDGHSTFDHPDDRAMIAQIKQFYGMDYDTHASYRFKEAEK
jgi:hypothetical protein